MALTRATQGVHAAAIPSLFLAFHATGLQYGPSYRALACAWAAAEAGVAAARLLDRAELDGMQVFLAPTDGYPWLALAFTLTFSLSLCPTTLLTPTEIHSHPLTPAHAHSHPLTRTHTHAYPRIPTHTPHTTLTFPRCRCTRLTWTRLCS